MENTISHQKYKIDHHGREALLTGICRICLFLFLYTASSKLIDHSIFLKGLNKIEILRPYASVISWIVPLAEVVVAVMLLVPRLAIYGLYCFIGMMSTFTVYIIGMLLWAKKLPCSCGGVIAQLSWAEHIWFNLAFILLALLGLRLSNSKSKLIKTK